MAPRQTILLADDQEGVRQLVRMTIASDAYLILEAADGDEAWAILQIMRPDVALLDVSMPGPDGFALTRAIRADRGERAEAPRSRPLSVRRSRCFSPKTAGARPQSGAPHGGCRSSRRVRP